MGKQDLVHEHTLTPKHTKLGDKPTKELLNKYNIALEQLPKISIKDPAIKGLDVSVGDVIKIERQSITAGRSAYYRLVIES